MKQIISIGGGGFSHNKSDLKLEKYILSQVQSSTPKICFLPQASREAQDYVVKFFDTFQSLGSIPSWVSLFGRVEDTWKEKLLNQDIIYVGGGNTKSMLALWKEWEVDVVLKEAYQKGILLAGVSAGAICWFEECVTDSVWPLGAIKGLGFLSGSCCPHFDTEPERAPAYREKVRQGEIVPGLALDDFTAAHFVDEQLKKVVTSSENSHAYWIGIDQDRPVDCILI